MTQSVGVKLEGIYYCPHVPGEACSCHKPLIGALTRATADTSLPMAVVVSCT